MCIFFGSIYIFGNVCITLRVLLSQLGSNYGRGKKRIPFLFMTEVTLVDFEVPIIVHLKQRLNCK